MGALMTYPAGAKIREGDRVLLDHGERSGVIEALLETKERFRAWGVDEPGVMIVSDYYGRLFLPTRSIERDDLALIARAGE